MLAGASLTSCSDPFDPSYLEEQIKGLQTRVESLENNLKGINQSITSLQSLVSALDKGIYVVSVDPADKGFKVTFSDGTVTTINVASEPSTPSDPIDVKVPEIGRTA